MHFTVLDAAIVLAYLIGIAAFGIWIGGRQTSAKDYFLSESAVPWWAVCFAIVATETSALTFLSIPGLAYVGNFNLLQLAIGYIIGRILVAGVLLPRYFQGELTTAYAFLETRFGPRLRKATSIVFQFTRLFADGVRLYTTAIPLALLIQGNAFLPHFGGETGVYVFSIGLLSTLTLMYVFIGGVRAVIWTDVIQLLLYITGAIIACFVIVGKLPAPISGIVSNPAFAAKTSIISFGTACSDLIRSPLHILPAIVGGMFLSMASHGADQLIIQRVLSTRSLRKARKAMILSGFIVAVQFALFLFVGTLLYFYFEGAPYSPNEVFATFILNHFPSGLSGLLVAAILAAAMSTLSGSISAISSATVMDILVPLRRTAWTDLESLRWSRRISFGWSVLLVCVASLFIGTPKAVIEIALSIASFTYGGLLGVFLLGILTKRTRETSALVGFFAGIAGMAVIITLTPIAWTWYTFVGSAICIIIAVIFEHLLPARGPA